MSLSINPTQLRESKSGSVRMKSMARGAQEGDEVSDWLVAEREFEESNEQPGPKKTRVAAASR